MGRGTLSVPCSSVHYCKQADQFHIARNILRTLSAFLLHLEGFVANGIGDIETRIPMFIRLFSGHF